MNASYVLIGSLIAPVDRFDRMAALAVAYLLAVGVSAHSLDAMAPNRPWGDFLSRRQLAALATAALVPSLGLGLYLGVTFAPLLLLVGAVELFFLLAYNLELFGGAFHTDLWFATSWGFLPVIAGFVVQTDTVSLASIAAGLFGFFTAYVEISASRPYKAIKQEGGGSSPLASKLEAVLKGIVLTVIAAAAFLMAMVLSR
jgi:4-hydroxybenzoate polyprenyltransferase